MNNNRLASVNWGPLSALTGTVLIFLMPQIVLAQTSLMVDGFTFTSLRFSPWLMFWIQTITAVSMLLLTAGFIYGKGSNLKSLGLKFKGPLKILKQVLIVFAVYFSVRYFIFIIMSLLVPESILNQPQDVGFSTSTSQAELIAVGLTLVVIAPIYEEVLFRGFLFSGLRKKLSLWPAALISSLIFGLLHWPVDAMVDVFVLSFGLCWLYERTNTIWAPIFLHTLKNAIAFFYVFVAT